MWRWDQGRLQYFQFNVMRDTARVLVRFDGIDIDQSTEPAFREALETCTSMPFKPKNYTIKRNYSRVFQCGLLCSFSKGKLIATDLCRELAKDDGAIESVDDYMTFFTQRFRFPFPAFQDYEAVSSRIYPACAVIKLLVARKALGQLAAITVEDLFFFLMANNCTGEEDIEFYMNLGAKIVDTPDSEIRQGREFLIFLSQFNFLKYFNSTLYLDLDSAEAVDSLVSDILVPQQRTPNRDRALELQEMGRIGGSLIRPALERFAPIPDEADFIEGKRRRVEHFRIERSPMLRRYYMLTHEHPVCDACGIDTKTKYPWTDFMLDVHHVLPLSSSLNITQSGTSLEDVVGLCPSCHRAVHSFYKVWLDENKQDDFVSKDEAHSVYHEARKLIA